MSEEYESDTFDGVSQVDSSLFVPTSNVFLSKYEDEILVGLHDKQEIFVSGIFDMEILKGGIKYNNIYHSSERKSDLTFVHPLSSSIPGIQSSHYDGWQEKFNSQPILDKFKACDKPTIDSFICIIKLTNSKSIVGLQEISLLYTDMKYLWKPRDYKQFDNSVMKKLNFAILPRTVNNFIPLEISKDWLQIIDKLTLFHKNSQYDMRTLIIGGKNTGKSTLLRLLMEKLITDNETLQYLDLDPGQPEISDPECLSISQFDHLNCLGSNWGKMNIQILKQFYLGVNSPQENPTEYFSLIDQLMTYFEQQNFPGSSFVNLPGWIKGFGVNIMNYVIRKYKPTHIILLTPDNISPLSTELDIPTNFESQLRDSYEPEIINLRSYHQQSSPFYNGSIRYHQLKFQPTQLRTIKTLISMHTVKRLENYVEFDFTPFLIQKPLQISFGRLNGIKGFRFFEEFANLHMDDIKIALEGTIVGLHIYMGDISKLTTLNGIYPMIQDGWSIDDIDYVTTLLIHSIDEKNQILNVYLPPYKVKELQTMFDQETNWVLVRGKTETPLCELMPPNNLLDNNNFTNIPYITKERRKKYEYVWKVRKNVQRRGHFMK